MALESEIMKVVKMLLDAYPTRKIENLAGFVQTAAVALENVPSMVLWSAARQWVAESKFFPTIAELRERAEKIKSETSRRGVDDARLEQKQNDRKLDEFAEKIQRFESLRPDDWTPADHLEFSRLMGRGVNWATEPVDAPWMAWKFDAVEV